ncbi:MAG: hypothetical protein GY938_01345 [Ketobacter sp.]|nr:hypothetical protein [Ketobacter sp.]
MVNVIPSGCLSFSKGSTSQLTETAKDDCFYCCAYFTGPNKTPAPTQRMHLNLHALVQQSTPLCAGQRKQM